MNNQVSKTSNEVIYVKSGDDLINRKSVLFVMFLLWIMFIFYNSSQTGHNSNSVSYSITRFVATGLEKAGFGPITIKEFRHLNRIIRKLAHGFQFFVFAIIFSDLLMYLKVKKKNMIFYTLLAVLLFAAGDEFHQLFVLGRKPSVIDVLIDFSGGVVGVMVVSVINRVKNIKIVV